MMKAAIFDMDGTLLDSMKMWQNLAPDFCREHNIEWTEQLENDLWGLGFVPAVEYFCENYPHLNMQADQMLDIWFETLANNYKNDVTPKIGVIEYLKKLNSMGIPCAVATMTEHRLADAALKNHKISEYMQHILTYEDVGGVGKEHPDLFLEAARRLNAKPEECVIFEDTLYAIETAKGAGFKVFAIADTAHTETEQIKSLSDRYINDFSDLL